MPPCRSSCGCASRHRCAVQACPPAPPDYRSSRVRAPAWSAQRTGSRTRRCPAAPLRTMRAGRRPGAASRPSGSRARLLRATSARACTARPWRRRAARPRPPPEPHWRGSRRKAAGAASVSWRPARCARNPQKSSPWTVLSRVDADRCTRRQCRASPARARVVQQDRPGSRRPSPLRGATTREKRRCPLNFTQRRLLERRA